MEEDILNYSPAVMFRGTPCIKLGFQGALRTSLILTFDYIDFFQ